MVGVHAGKGGGAVDTGFLGGGLGRARCGGPVGDAEARRINRGGQRAFPRKGELGESGHDGGVLLGQIDDFSAVGGDSMQSDALRRGAEDEFPIAVAHGESRPPIGFGRLAGPFPENRPRAPDGLAVESGEQVFTVSPIVGGQRDFRGGAEGRQQVDGRERRAVVGRPGGSVPRPTHEEGHAHAAFEEAAFLAAEATGGPDAVVAAVAGDAGIVVAGTELGFRCGGLGAVVAGKNHDGVFLDAGGLERIEHATDGVVTVGDHSGVNALLRVKVRPFFQRGLRGYVRQMALVEPDVEEERSRLVCGDEPRGVVGCRVQIGGGGFGAAVEDGELVEAVGGGDGRAVRVAIGQMPFAEVRRTVSGLLEKTRGGRGAGVEPVRHAAGLVLFGGGEVLVDPEARGEHARHRGGATRRAHGIKDIELVKISSLARQPVEVRRLQPGVSVGGKIAPTPVVGENEDDVRARGGFLLGREDGRSRKQDEQEESGAGKATHEMVLRG